MHVSTREVDQDGVHIITDVLEADGAGELVSAAGKVSAKVISVQRTASGGIQVQTAVEISEPAAPVQAAPPSEAEQAKAYLVGKGQKAKDADANVAKFGATRILARKAAEAEAKEKDLDGQLDDVLGLNAAAGQEEKKPN